ncbi:olfactory receptor 6M1-like [Rhinophrynus dorsalis]
MTFSSQVTLFSFLLLIYIITLAGNLLIIFIIWRKHHLHIPMYFFLVNFSFLEICFTSSIMPKFLSILVSGNRVISFWGCITQCYFYFFLGSVELFLLAVMSFDRYIAICFPLRYISIMSPGLCLCLALAVWAGGFLSTIVQTVLISALIFCRCNVIDHFFCDVEPLLKLACSDTSLIKIVNMFFSSLIVFGSLQCIFVSYLLIILAIFKVSIVGGRWKTFSTCVSHLILVIIVYGSSAFLCMRSVTVSSMNFTKLSVVLTGIVTPLLNPFIYTLRNSQVLEALKELTAGWTFGKIK